MPCHWHWSIQQMIHHSTSSRIEVRSGPYRSIYPQTDSCRWVLMYGPIWVSWAVNMVLLLLLRSMCSQSKQECNPSDFFKQQDHYFVFETCASYIWRDNMSSTIKTSERRRFPSGKIENCHGRRRQFIKMDKERLEGICCTLADPNTTLGQFVFVCTITQDIFVEHKKNYFVKRVAEIWNTDWAWQKVNSPPEEWHQVHVVPVLLKGKGKKDHVHRAHFTMTIDQ